MTKEELLLNIIEDAYLEERIELYLSGEQFTSLPSALGKLSHLRILVLSHNHLSKVPASVQKLVNLSTLDLSSNRLIAFPSSVGKLISLFVLDLGGNQLTTLPAEIGQLSNLKSLDLSGNQLTALPAEIGHLVNLRSLNLSDNQLVSIPVDLGRLSNLSKLDLGGNQLTALPAEIGQLSNLKSLDLSGNQLTALPAEIGQLSNLKSLDLKGNCLKRLATEFIQLTELDSLDLRGNWLRTLPTELTQLTNLSKLSLARNGLSTLSSEVGKLIDLSELDLSENQLQTLPVDISLLSKLQLLNVSDNQLETLPPEIGLLKNLRQLDLDENPLLSLPPEIQRRGLQEILNFYRQKLAQDFAYLYEAKLLIIGEGGAGKTTLARKIQEPTYQLQEDEISTDGIDILQYRFPLEDGKEFQVNIWDFGGQQIYHETHQFFLTKRSLYVLVADARKEDTDFYYWLNVVQLLSDNSPLLIIKNEKQNIKLAINERQLRGEFTNLKETFATNFSDNRGLSEILTSLKYYISSLPHVGTELPRNWVKVRKALEQEQRNYISLDEYLQICQNNGFTSREDKLQLSGYLHDLGVCLHFHNDDVLNKTVILKPTWGTDAVYKVLRNPQVTQNLGRFTRQDLTTIWREEKYAAMHFELLRLMMNFKLCYEIPSSPGRYIAPQLLSPEQTEYEWDESENLLLRYEYEFMPKGIFTRFIVEMHQWIEDQTHVWKNGMVLSKDDARAEVIELYRYHKGEIRIRVTGNRKRDLLTTVRHELDKIHDSYERLRYNTLVPCNCDTCKNSQMPHFYQLQVLHRFLDNRQHQIQCQGSFQMVDVPGLIDDVIPRAYNSSSQLQRSQQQQADLQKVWEIRNEKLGRLRQDLATATETTRKFELEQQIQVEKEALAQLAAELDDIEQQLSE